MRGRRLLSLLVSVSFLSAACGDGGSRATAGLARSNVTRSPRTEGDAAAATAAVNQLGLTLLAPHLGPHAGNVVISPWSVAFALAMTHAGARGATATEMEHVLGIDDPSTFDAAMNALAAEVTDANGSFRLTNGDPGNVELSSADQLFAQEGVPFAAPFLDTLARYYGAGVGLVDYAKQTDTARRAVNTWVSDHTRARIAELLTPGTLDAQTRLVLVNAVYLAADWATPFDPKTTTDAPFHAPGKEVTAKFMHEQEQLGFASGDGWVSVTLPYAGEKLAMTLVLPDGGRFADVAAHLGDALAAPTTTATVALALPKFDIAFRSSLQRALRDAGMVTAFDATSADFSGMTEAERLSIADVVHAANLTVDEKGTVAAAATAVIMRATAAPSEVEHVTVDRPFLFALRATATGTVLFSGQVTDPTA